MAVIRLGTRSSALARWQAEWVKSALNALGVDVQIVFITTQGDVKTGPLGTIGGQGLFTKEIQRALLAKQIDLAVHSLKDLPTLPVDNLAVTAIPERETTDDAFLSVRYDSLDSLPQRAKVGTGSARRRTQLLHVRQDLQVLDIRGNLDTRIKKLEEGEYDAILLAAAGLKRLGWAERIRQLLPKSIMLPAVGQGALGLETRSNDIATRNAIAPLNHMPTANAVIAERAMLAELRGGCLAPVGAWARVEQGELVIDACVLNATGSKKICAATKGNPGDAFRLGQATAFALRQQGADALLAEARTSPT